MTSLIRPSQLHPQHGLLPQRHQIPDVDLGMRLDDRPDGQPFVHEQLHGAALVGDVSGEGCLHVALERDAGQAKARGSIHADERGRSYGAGQG
jgi:hypothetical protein